MKYEDFNNKLLVVDDSDLIRHSLKNFFKEYNLEVLTSTNGLEGIQKAVEHIPGLIFLDLMMPNMDGIKMLQVLKVLNDVKHIPVIVISSNTDKKNVLAAIEAGADRVISKPLQKDVIIKHINDLLGVEFLPRAKNYLMSEMEKQEIKAELIKFFLKSFPGKKQKIAEAIYSKDSEMLKIIAHELKGAGGTIDLPALTELSAHIENKLEFKNIDWSYISLKCEQIFKIVNGVNSKLLQNQTC